MVIEPPVAIAAKRTTRSDNAGRSCANSGRCSRLVISNLYTADVVEIERNTSQMSEYFLRL